MVIMSNLIQSGWDFEHDDTVIDNVSVGTTSSFNRNENPTKNDEDPNLSKFLTKSTHTNASRHIDEEGWTTTSPGNKKPKNNINDRNVASTESIIESIDGNFDTIEAGTRNIIHVTSPGRKHKCNIPDDDNRNMELDFNPVRTAEYGKDQDKQHDETEKEESRNNQNQTNGDKNSGDENGNKDDDKDNNSNNNHYNGGLNHGGRSGRGGRGGRGGRRGERKQIPRIEWETYDFTISFNPKTMSNKDPDAEFQAVLSEIMKKSPGVTFHPTNESMYPKPRPFTSIQEYPQTEAAFKDFFDVYVNKSLTTFKIFVKATMQYNELELRNSLLNYLRSNNLWMSSDLISENVDEMIGYVNYGHDKMVWRPECEKKINNGIQALIQSGSVPEALRLKIASLKKQIHVRVAIGTIRGGPRNDPVMCEGLVLRTTKAQARASIELLGLLDDNILGNFYSIIPRGVDRDLGPKLYGDFLRANNDMMNKLRAIAVVNWPEELFLDHYNPALGVAGTVPIRVERLLMDVWKCAAIERTTETESRGKYLLLFRDEDMEKAKVSIGNLIDAFGRDSDRKCAKIALEKFNEFPEFDSIQRISQSVHSKGLRIREMLEAAASQRTKGTPKKIQQPQPQFQFHVNKELQQQLPITAQKSYSSILTQQLSPTKKHLTIVQPSPQQIAQPIGRQQNITQTAQAPPDARTVLTNNSGLSIDQQTITTMMTQITTQFSEMERERIMREDRNEMKRQDREAKAEEKRDERDARMEERRLETEDKMYSFLQTMMTININKKDNNDQVTGTLITTGTTEQTSALTNSIATTNTATSSAAKRPHSQQSNNNEETEMTDAETVIESQETEEDPTSIKRNRTVPGGEEFEHDKATTDDMDLATEHNDQMNSTRAKNGDTASFTDGFYNQQFRLPDNVPPPDGVSQQ